MAELTGLGYFPGKSILHEMDLRVKMICLALASLTGLNASPAILWTLTGALIVAAVAIRLPVAAFFIEIRYFVFLLLLVFFARLLFTPGIEIWGFAGLVVTREGVTQGVFVCWRLCVVLLAGLVFVTTSRPVEIKTAVEWFLKPVPGIPERQVGTMLGLIVRFIPLIFKQARETADAQKARGSDLKKNPVRRLTRFAVPLIRRSFESADHLAMAMEARCYNENRTPRPFSVHFTDWVLLGGMAALAGFSIISWDPSRSSVFDSLKWL